MYFTHPPPIMSGFREACDQQPMQALTRVDHYQPVQMDQVMPLGFTMDASKPQFVNVNTSMSCIPVDGADATKLLMFPLDMSDWVPVENAPVHEDSWLKNAYIEAINMYSVEASRADRTRGRRARCPEELAKRRAHRRAMQKGYERGYRERKRQTREQLREEWLQLEEAMQAKARAVQSELMVTQHMHSVTPPTMRDAAEAAATEISALRTEQALLKCQIRAQTKLADATDYFAQEDIRKRVNVLSSTPFVLNFTFKWD